MAQAVLNTHLLHKYIYLATDLASDFVTHNNLKVLSNHTLKAALRHLIIHHTLYTETNNKLSNLSVNVDVSNGRAAQRLRLQVANAGRRSQELSPFSREVSRLGPQLERTVTITSRPRSDAYCDAHRLH